MPSKGETRYGEQVKVEGPEKISKGNKFNEERYWISKENRERTKRILWDKKKREVLRKEWERKMEGDDR